MSAAARLASVDKAKIEANKWNFVAFSYDHKAKKGVIQVGDSYGYSDLLASANRQVVLICFVQITYFLRFKKGGTFYHDLW